ncbi:hypothetical protein [Dyadobacter frigoris]|uniref:C1q domain-containing protein n=1 Tax=Dyadobacter frigoris TaxID=2576211 RepID=A0A4U6CPJ3_9BACT|nr:hypothetical protein [Dyadobacter frigoris]TKT85321.1 hypothetical protein FDK13_33980 [Dyadobacter frigoris]GLU56948.1 hypothetical protein Dfri01_64090 [Dyadobacter frigoris]
MNNKQFLKKAYAAAMVAVMVCSSSALFAQVKIGTNPTLINAANNLEVEASTAGRKTSVDKTTGQVTIKDGTEGTGKVLTSDVAGGASWQPFGTPTLAVQAKVKLQDYSYYPTASRMNFGTTVFDNSGSILANAFIAPSSGVYMVKAGSFMSPLGSGSTGPFNIHIQLYVNAVFKETIASPVVFAGTNNFVTGVVILRVNAGDELSITSDSQQAGGYFYCSGGDVVFAKISN